ncbi:MAG: hypothetical protein C0200_02005 [Thermoproteota archaeon]|nr:MAG: hypothetical protein C0200_02005 [Candidatus Korarchaeota archaeon]
MINMTYTKFYISREIAELFPELRIGVLKSSNLTIARGDEELEIIKREAVDKALRKDISADPRLILWVETYKKMGINPKKYPPTVVSLADRVARTKRLPAINTFVDSYLIIELKYFLPVGGYDLDKVRGSIHLRRSQGGERFVPLGSQKEEVTKPGEVVYADEEKILTRFWNYRDSEMTKITESTRNAVLMMEAPDRTVGDDELKNALEELSELITRFNGGHTSSFIENVEEGLAWNL